jgi:hypothetical protein
LYRGDHMAPAPAPKSEIVVADIEQEFALG